MRPCSIEVRAGAAVLLALALTGCSNPLSGDQPKQLAGQDRAGRALTAVEAKSALPSVPSLPAGWVPAKNILRPTAGGTFRPARCGALDEAVSDAFLGARAKGYRTYVSRGRAAMGIGIASHEQAAPTFAGARAAVPGCQTFRTIEGKASSPVSLRPLRLPGFGHEAVVLRMHVRQAGVLGTWDVVRVRVGHNVILGDLVTPGTGRPNTRPLVTAVKNALLNLS